jgi:hypothetical protein
MTENNRISLWNKLLKFREENLILKKEQYVDFVSNRTGKSTKYNYANINDLLELINDKFVQCKLVPFQRTVIKETKPFYFMETTIVDSETGETTPPSFFPLFIDNKFKNDMQDIGAACTYARRYGLLSVLCMQQEDNDSDYQRKFKKESPAPQKISITAEELNPSKFYKFTITGIYDDKDKPYLKVVGDTELGKASTLIYPNKPEMIVNISKSIGISPSDFYPKSEIAIGENGFATLKISKDGKWLNFNSFKPKETKPDNIVTTTNDFDDDIPF